MFYWGQLVALKSPTSDVENPVSGSALTKKAPSSYRIKHLLNPCAPKLIILMSMQEKDHSGNGWFKNSKCHTAEIKIENMKW